MDPATVVLVIAAHLLCSGALLFVIGQRLPPRGGVALWAGGLLLFGAGCALRLAAGLQTHHPSGLVADLAMVAAALLLIAGLRDFSGRPPLRRGTGATVLLAWLALELAALAWFGWVGRYVVLHATLALLYAWMVAAALAAMAGVEPAVRRPLRLLVLVTGLLGLLMLARGLHIASAGLGVLLRGPFAQVFHACVSLAALLLAMSMLWMVFERLAGQLAALATRDALTRVLNRSGLDEALARHFGARGATPMALLAIDVDHFKRINDSLGHAAGDGVLRELAGTLMRHVRPNDLVARVGGDEFVVCTTAADAASAQALAERLRSAVAAGGDGQATACTVSIGVSRPMAALTDWPRAAAEADRALYAAKAAGRDRVLAA